MFRLQQANKRVIYNVRNFSTRKFPSRTNTIINFLPDGREYIIERMGKYEKTVKPGLQILTPIIQKIAYQIDKREMCIVIDPQQATTNDNVMVNMSGNLYIEFEDAYKAAYGAEEPIYSAIQLAQSSMRTAVGLSQLDKLFSDRDSLNHIVTQSMNGPVKKWGAKVNRFEITDLQPSSEDIAHSLDKQAMAERERREIEINAQAEKKAAELRADAYKYKLRIEAEGDAEKVKLEAEADRFKIEQKAEGDRFKVEQEAKAKAEYIEKVGKSIEENVYGRDVLAATVSSEYFDTLGHMAKKGNTYIIPQSLSDTASLIATGKTMLDSLPQKQRVKITGHIK